MSAGPSLAKTHGGWRPPCVTCMLAALVAGLYAVLGPAPEPLVFEPARPADAAPWRALTGHLVHSDLRHLAWNLAALLCLGTLYESIVRPRPMRYLGLLLAAALAIDLWLWALAPELARYCGLSGVLNALMAALVLQCWRLSRPPLFLLSGLAAASKILLRCPVGADHGPPGCSPQPAYPQAFGRDKIRLVWAPWGR